MTKHDGTLEQSFKRAKFDLRSLKTELSDLKVDFEITFKAEKNCKTFAKKFEPLQTKMEEVYLQYDSIMVNMRKVMKDLFDISEQVAMKEMTADPKAFI